MLGVNTIMKGNTECPHLSLRKRLLDPGIVKL